MKQKEPHSESRPKNPVELFSEGVETVWILYATGIFKTPRKEVAQRRTRLFLLLLLLQEEWRLKTNTAPPFVAF